MKYLYLITLSLLIISCESTKQPEEIIDASIIDAGGNELNNTEIEFLFRDIEYGAKHQDGQYEYVRLFKNDSSELIRDVLTNNGFYREINGEKVEVVDSMATKYSNSINSVIYFALLPIKLDAPAVNPKMLGQVEIKEKKYHKIQITFDKQGGGSDYQDVFIYWFNTETNKVDYLAYSYETDGGGMRFREAYNERYVNGIRFVDYINYKPKSEIDLSSIDQAFLSGQLDTLSKIEAESIKVNELNENIKM